MTNQLFNGNCLNILPIIESDSVDLCIADPPYAQTQNDWDIEIPLDKLWNELTRVVKSDGAIILFGQGMFTAKVMMSNPKMWKYNLIWDKKLTTGFLNAKKMPLRQHEDLMVFYRKLPVYNPQKVEGSPNHGRKKSAPTSNNNYGDFKYTPTDESGLKYPTSIICFSKPHSSVALHPTEKPVELIEWLIKTYSNKADTILDFCMGCGSTGVAALNLGRNFIGIEKNSQYYEIAKERIEGYPDIGDFGYALAAACD